MALDQTGPDYPYEKNMGFFDHIDELRKRLVRISLMILVVMIAVFFYVPYIFENIILAPYKPNFWGYKFFCKMGRYFTGTDITCWNPPALDMQSQQIQGQFVAAFKISFILSIVVTFPYIVNQIWLFIKPALSAKEINKTRRSLGVVSLLFFAGVLFSYYFLVPIASNFLLSYSLSDKIRNVITITSVTGFVTFMSLATGLVFEMPVLIFILARLGMITSSALIKRWRIALVVIFIIAAVATPSPDIFSQFLLAFPLILLYILSIFIARRVESRKAVEELVGEE